jgi:hypothetical protein
LAKSNKYNCAYSVDLSSATDRLPIDLQVGILDFMSGLSIGKLWKDILVLRPYMIRNNKYIKDIEYVHYSTGQPMGCLSSWAMLAVTHHYILQTCAFHVYGTRRWFDKYEILGDDLVIFDKLVYQEYCRLMDLLQVGVNPSKSLISHDVTAVEFAKRTGINGIDVSGLSWKQFISENTIMGRMNLVLSASRKGLITSVPMILQLLARTKGESLLSTENGRKILETSLMGLLGYLSNIGRLSLIDAVAFTVDPLDEDREKMDQPSLPLTMTLHEILGLLQPEVLSSNCKWEPTRISCFDDRREVAREIVGFMADSLARDSLATMLLFNSNYDSALKAYSLSLISDEFDISLFPKIEQSQLVSFAELFLLKERDPDDLADEVYNFMYKLKELPTMKEATKFKTLVDNFISSFKFESNSRITKHAEVAWMQKDIANAGNMKERPYWLLLS